MTSLAQQGHEVSLINHTKEVARHRGVQCIPMVLEGERLRRLFEVLAPDAVVVLSTSSAGRQLRPLLPEGTPLILWTGHAVNQPHHEALGERELRDAWDGFVFMGRWQLETVCERFGLERSKAVDLGMGIAPPFEGVFDADESILASKRGEPVIVYTSTPFRGLEVLVDCFPAIRERVPDVRLRIFSSMKIYQVEGDGDPFGELYERCRGLEGVDYVGPLAQAELAAELKRASVLAYPNTFAETACVAMMEAMASGCSIVSSHMGALPQTTAGFGTLLREQPGSAEYRSAFVESVVQAVEAMMGGEDDAVEDSLASQVRYCNEHYRWGLRSRQWVEWLGERCPS
jgi:glycosyltransferase involved in cell wall biosynthesis